MKKLLAVLILALLTLTLAACGGKATTASQDVQPPPTEAQEQPTAPPSPTQPAAPHTLDTQTSDAGRVVIDVTPLTLSGKAWDFEVALNTHSVNLDFDLTEVGVLRCDQGQEYTPIAWDGSGPGGHHRSGVLKFAALDHPTLFVEIAIRDVAQVPERVFRWNVPGSAESSPGSSAAQAAVPQSSPVADEGPARVALSDQEFYYGDVVMSEGIVSRVMDITNTGAGVLRIEGVEPT